MKQRTVLISGAGVAGPTLAYWLSGYGFRPTVVERSAGQRSSGNPVDVRGEATDVAEQMGVDKADVITGLTPPSALGNLSVSAYPSSAGNVSLHFCNASQTPATAPAGVYSFVMVH